MINSSIGPVTLVRLYLGACYLNAYLLHFSFPSLWFYYTVSCLRTHFVSFNAVTSTSMCFTEDNGILFFWRWGTLPFSPFTCHLLHCWGHIYRLFHLYYYLEVLSPFSSSFVVLDIKVRSFIQFCFIFVYVCVGEMRVKF